MTEGPTDEKVEMMHVYAEDQQPCIVAKKSCGCYCAASGIDDFDIRQDFESLIDFLHEMKSCAFELRPVSFVRSGGLTFDCKHK